MRLGASTTVTKLASGLLHLALALLLELTLGLTAHAQPASQLPPGMTPEQMDSIVSAITKSVLEKLKEEARPATVTPAIPQGLSNVPDTFDVLLEQTTGLVVAMPAVWRGLAGLVERLDGRTAGERGRMHFLLLLAAGVAAALGSELSLRRSLRPWRSALAQRASPEWGPKSFGYVSALALLDIAGVLAFWLVGRAVVTGLFTSGSFQDRFAVAALAALFIWRLYVLLFRVILRPRLSAARLCEVTDDLARRAHRLISGFVLLLVLLRLLGLALIAADTPTVAVEAARLLIVPFLFLAFVMFVLRMDSPARQWLGGLGRTAPVARFVGEYWLSVTLGFFFSLALTLAYGAASGRHGVSGAILLTMNLVFGLLLFETFLQAIVRRFDSQLAGYSPASDKEKLPDVIARCLRVAVLILVVVVVSEHWVVDVLDLVNERDWNRLTRAARAAGLTLFSAFVLWELVKYFTDAYMQGMSRRGAEDVVASASASAATRLGTLMPLVRFVLAVLIGTVALLIALTDIGVDITPLLAGLSVFGLAVSFGSQTLVKDIVSGVFYLADDAFRVGEQIDSGKATGIVEGFTLRSIRLRHSSGHVYTIPFGELGQIANFSRDWASVKFTLRFARETDLDRLRTATAALGAELMDDPAFAGDILEPLKMQGVGEIADNALVVRFKFKARPGNPGRIQDEVVQRMLRTFPSLSLQLA